jgi:hypothetical protein
MAEVTHKIRIRTRIRQVATIARCQRIIKKEIGSA